MHNFPDYKNLLQLINILWYITIAQSIVQVMTMPYLLVDILWVGTNSSRQHVANTLILCTISEVLCSACSLLPSKNTSGEYWLFKNVLDFPYSECYILQIAQTDILFPRVNTHLYFFLLLLAHIHVAKAYEYSSKQCHFGNVTRIHVIFTCIIMALPHSVLHLEQEIMHYLWSNFHYSY